MDESRRKAQRLSHKSDEDLAKAIALAIRVGELPYERVLLAARLGYPPAMGVTGVKQDLVIEEVLEACYDPNGPQDPSWCWLTDYELILFANDCVEHVVKAVPDSWRTRKPKERALTGLALLRRGLIRGNKKTIRKSREQASLLDHEWTAGRRGIFLVARNWLDAAEEILVLEQGPSDPDLEATFPFEEMETIQDVALVAIENSAQEAEDPGTERDWQGFRLGEYLVGKELGIV